MKRRTNIDFRGLYAYRFEELLMLFRRNGQSLTDEHRNTQNDPVIDICGSDFRAYRSVIANNESWVVYSVEKYSLQGTTQGRYLTGGVPPVRFSM